LNNFRICGLLGRVTTLVWTCLPEYETQRDDIFETVFRPGRLILGDSVRGFEEEYAAYHGSSTSSVLVELPQHGHYIDVQARTLVTCLPAMVTGLPAVEPG
jgi:hypothetical protein